MNTSVSHSRNNSWQIAGADVFWKDIAVHEHVVQLYENDEVFLETLAGFVGGGINAGDCCIVIATKSHLNALNVRLREHVVSVATLLSDYRYIPLDAGETLSKFMINDWPDEQLFNQTVSGVIGKAVANHRNIRAFGEMVAILWDQGNKEAAIELERLWNKFCSLHPLSLFCAYPQQSFGVDADEIGHVCQEHCKLLAGSARQLTTIYYRDIQPEKMIDKASKESSLMGAD
jgi:hypothetical protein